MTKTFLHVGCGPKRKNQTTRGFNTPDWTELRLDIDDKIIKGVRPLYSLVALSWRRHWQAF